jgi:hypothetical protein
MKKLWNRISLTGIVCAFVIFSPVILGGGLIFVMIWPEKMKAMNKKCRERMKR